MSDVKEGLINDRDESSLPKEIEWAVDTKFIAYITKYSLTKGVFKVIARPSLGTQKTIRVKISDNDAKKTDWLILDRTYTREEYALTAEEACEHFRRQRKEKIEELERKIKKLKNQNTVRINEPGKKYHKSI